MKTLFAANSEIRLVRFLNDHSRRLRLLCDPGFVADLYYARRDEKDAPELTAPVQALSIETMDSLRALAAGNDEPPLFVVAAPANEAERLRTLREEYPKLAFVGLAEHVVPALVAQAAHRLFEPAPASGKPGEPLKLAIVFATPRSGSSYVCDILDGLGVGRPKEHLRDTLIELFASSYRFDKIAAIRNFLRYSARDGWVGTKLITHFVDDFVTTCGLADVATAFDIPIDIYPIFLDRQDRTMQAISGELAARRGVWHITDATSRQKIDGARAVRYDFHSILKRYLGYSSQSAFLGALRELFGRRLDLVYETDVVDQLALADRLATFLGVDGKDRSFVKAAQRERIANSLNDQFRASFANDYFQRFGSLPRKAELARDPEHMMSA
jgi:LPS sulfotransferase NodH